MEDLLRLSAERAIRYLATLDERGVAPTPAAFGDYIKTEIRKYQKVVEAAGIRAD